MKTIYFAGLKKNKMSLVASMVASAGETDRDLAWTQLAQKLGVYIII